MEGRSLSCSSACCLGDEEACSRRLKGLRHVLLRGADLEPEQQIRLVNRPEWHRLPNLLMAERSLEADNGAAAGQIHRTESLHQLLIGPAREPVERTIR